MGVDVSQIRQLSADLGKASGDTVRKAQTVIAKTAADCERIAKSLAPVDTGALRNSISTTVGGLTATVGPTVSYGAYVEFGTSRMRPEPYMNPAADAVTPGFEKAMEQLEIL